MLAPRVVSENVTSRVIENVCILVCVCVHCGHTICRGWGGSVVSVVSVVPVIAVVWLVCRVE